MSRAGGPKVLFWYGFHTRKVKNWGRGGYDLRGPPDPLLVNPVMILSSASFFSTKFSMSFLSFVLTYCQTAFEFSFALFSLQASSQIS